MTPPYIGTGEEPAAQCACPAGGEALPSGKEPGVRARAPPVRREARPRSGMRETLRWNKLLIIKCIINITIVVMTVIADLSELEKPKTIFQRLPHKFSADSTSMYKVQRTLILGIT